MKRETTWPAYNVPFDSGDGGSRRDYLGWHDLEGYGKWHRTEISTCKVLPGHTCS